MTALTGVCVCVSVCVCEREKFKVFHGSKTKFRGRFSVAQTEIICIEARRKQVAS